MQQVNYRIKGLISVVLSLALLLAAHVPLQATAPISGDTHSFGSSGDIQNASNAVLALTLADLDNDGYADGAYGDGSDLKVAENDGSPFDGWPAADTVGTAGNTISGVDAADFDFDGWMDLVSVTQGGSSNEVKLWQNSSGPFTNPWTISNTLTNTLAFSLTCVATGDLDNDGAIDVAVAGDTGTILIWHNPLTPTIPFTTSWGSPVTVGTRSAGIEDLVLADLDRDGDLDIVTGSQNEDAELVAWENDGTPFDSSWSPHDIGATSSDSDIRALAAGDLDGDGDIDVATGLAGSPWLVVWQNDGGPFNDAWNPINVDSSNPATAVSDIVLADLDLDGDLDLAGVYGTAVRSWQNDGSPFSGSWALQPDIGTAGNTVNVLAAGDLEDDGDIDLVSGSNYSASGDEILAWRNTLIHRNIPDTQDYTGTSVGSSSSNVGEVAMADLDGDGDLDMVSGSAAGVLTIWQNNGTPFSSVWPHLDLATTYSISALAVGDVDGDGNLDIVAGETGAAPRLRIWWNDGTPFGGGWVSSIVDNSYAEPVAALALGDLDHDGDLDIVSGSGVHMQFNSNLWKIIAWRNNDISWSPNTVYTLTYTIETTTYASTVNALALGDLDNDGDLDIVAGTDRGIPRGTIDDPVDPSEWPDLYQLRAYENDGTPFSDTWLQTNVGRDKEEITLSNPTRYHGYWGATVFSVDLADFDLDGDLDIVSGDHVEADYMVKVWRNDGSPFSGEQEWDSAAVAIGAYAPWLDSSVWSVKAVDYDLDGDSDIVSGSGESERQVVTWENSGQPFQYLIPDGTTLASTTWSRHNVGSCDPGIRDVLSVAVGDLDKDGDPDVGGAMGQFYNPQSPYGVNVWRNQGGSVTEEMDPTVSPTDTLKLTEDKSYELLAVTVTHNGIAGDNDIELKEWRLLFEEATGDPLTSDEANALIDTLWIYRESNVTSGWQIADTMVLTATNLTGGVQALSFAEGPGVWITPTASINFYVVARIASAAGMANPRTFQITFDPDADSIVEDRAEDTSVSVQDSGPTTAGTFVAIGPPHHMTVEYAGDGAGGEVLTTTLLSGYSIVSYSITRDRHGNFIGNDPAYWSLIDRTGGISEADLSPYVQLSPMATFTGHLTGTAKIRALRHPPEEHIDGTSGTITVEQGHVWVEDQADGTGSEVITATLLVGESLSVYAVGRYDNGDFFSNVPVTWTMSITGNILPADLVPAPDGKSATFTPSVTGTVQILADHATMVDDSTGVITVEQGHVWVEDQADGTGSEVITDTLLVGESLTMYAVGRYDNGAFVGNVPVTWTISFTGNITSTDLSLAPDGKSAVFTPSGAGTAQILADHATMMDDATEVITVTSSQPEGSHVYLPIVVKGYGGQ